MQLYSAIHLKFPWVNTAPRGLPVVPDITYGGCILDQKGVKDINKMITPTKIILTAISFDTAVEFVVRELKRDKKLRKFFQISDEIQMQFKCPNSYLDFNLIRILKS